MPAKPERLGPVVTGQEHLQAAEVAEHPAVPRGDQGRAPLGTGRLGLGASGVVGHPGGTASDREGAPRIGRWSFVVPRPPHAARMAIRTVVAGSSSMSRASSSDPRPASPAPGPSRSRSGSPTWSPTVTTRLTGAPCRARATVAQRSARSDAPSSSCPLPARCPDPRGAGSAPRSTVGVWTCPTRSRPRWPETSCARATGSPHAGPRPPCEAQGQVRHLQHRPAPRG